MLVCVSVRYPDFLMLQTMTAKPPFFTASHKAFSTGSSGADPTCVQTGQARMETRHLFQSDSAMAAGIPAQPRFSGKKPQALWEALISQLKLISKQERIKRAAEKEAESRKETLEMRLFMLREMAGRAADDIVL